jgi:hypothetical protein
VVERRSLFRGAMREEAEGKTSKKYRIPEQREPTVFDYIAQKVVPEVFRFAEYVTLAGFALYLAKKTESAGLHAFAMLLYACLFWYVMDKQIAFVKVLEFRNIWVMRITSWSLLIAGGALIMYVQWLMSSIASAQLNG